ncbi:extracellular solute-binding protein [Virgibacillus halodenitrificans]|uniref:Extracellular solute-binding protein n=1 Tax=Virgibacillus halodenitrificans TaxID=1482 RepID=A0ABR7VHB6_VIRHA|nr:extracellular solute-binding protein [Virgibacillus halodenitrificans]MBD1221338.1 extracellular solute-binding protein [Virgibacillus halodenitrificans]
MNKCSKSIWIITLILLTLMTACSNEGKGETTKAEENLDNLHKEGMPVVKEEINLDFFSASNPEEGDWNDILIWDEYSAITNVNIEWQQVPNATLEEKRNLTLASGDIPDAFYAAGLTNLDLFKYGKQGTFIKLNDLIEEYAPNLTKLMEEHPEVRKAITFPDGNIYSLPTIQDPNFLSLLVGARPWYNEAWLEKLDMDMPETTEEYYQYLKAVKETDLNENGKLDEIPYGGRNLNELIRWLRGSYGLNDQGQTFIDTDPKSGDIRFVPTSDEYKEMLQFIAKLYDEELINQNIFTIENDQFLANGAQSLYGSTVFYSPDKTFGEQGEAYIGGLPLKGPHGDQSFSKSNAVGRVDGLVITSANEHPAATVRWLDYFYSDEGSRFQYMGIEGETYQETSDGEYEYVEEITNSPEGLTLDQEIRKRLAWVGIWPPGIMKQEYFMGSETSEKSLEATEKLKPYLSDESWSKFTYTEDENRVLTSVGADIEKYVNEMRDKFVAGKVDFSEWDNYVKEIESMGLDEYMKVQKEAFKRYKDE